MARRTSSRRGRRAPIQNLGMDHGKIPGGATRDTERVGEKKQTLLITRGLPASGKTTWAEWWIRESSDLRMLVSGSQLRDRMGSAQMCTTAKENEILKIQSLAVEELISRGFDVVCDDRFLSNVSVEKMFRLARKLNVNFIVVDFYGVSLALCIERDAERKNPVGEDVIRQMFARVCKIPEDAIGTGEELYIPEYSGPGCWEMVENG